MNVLFLGAKDLMVYFHFPTPSVKPVLLVVNLSNRFPCLSENVFFFMACADDKTFPVKRRSVISATLSVSVDVVDNNNNWRCETNRLQRSCNSV